MARRFGLLLLTFVAIVTVVSQAQAQALLTRHTREAVVSGQASSVGRLPATKVINFSFVLALRHAPELRNFLQDVYDPTSSNYHHYVTPAEFAARFGASKEDYDAVVQFAKASGFKVTGGSLEGRNVQLKGTVASIEKALHVTMGVYQHPEENRTFFAPDREPSVDLPFQLWHITGLDNYSIPRSMLAHRDSKLHSNVVKGSCPGSSYCGSDMRAAYYGTGSLTGTGQNIALLELAGTDLADLTTYYKNVKQTEPYTPTLVSTGGYSVSCLASSGCDDTEQTIDMTQAMGMAPGSKMLYMFVCGDAFVSGTFDETACLAAMVTTKAAPLSLQISSSWAWKPADPSTDDPYFQQMAAQGQSFFDAAGDSKEWSASNFAYPAEDDYVISVGGTDLQVSSAGGPWASETAWPDSGGGISPDGIPIPSWQQTTGVITSQNKGSKTLRNGPDVAAEANFDFYFCSDQGACSTGLGGTSFAAPMWAGYMALANQQAAASGAPAPGFINPAVYSLGLGSGYATDFHDITTGTNGFPAVAGYDLVTGWGSPNGAGLINALTGPGGPSFSLTATPNSLTIAQGASGTSTITVVPAGGFSGSVTLSASGLPSGVTAGFSPNPTTSTSTLTLAASATAATGTSTVTITGVSGTLTETTTVSLTVTGSGGPIVTLVPASLTWGKVLVGVTKTKSITLTNSGTAALNFSAIATSGDFGLTTIAKSCKVGTPVNAGKTCKFKVTFKPTQTGTRTGNLTITDNAPGSPQQAPLSGTGK